MANVEAVMRGDDALVVFAVVVGGFGSDVNDGGGGTNGGDSDN